MPPDCTWANELQQQIIEFQNDQIKALLKKLGKKRVLLTDDQRRVLAVKGHDLQPRCRDTSETSRDCQTPVVAMPTWMPSTRIGRLTILDESEDDSVELFDGTPGADIFGEDSPAAARLKQLARDVFAAVQQGACGI